MIYFDYVITRVINFHRHHLSGQGNKTWCASANYPYYTKLKLGYSNLSLLSLICKPVLLYISGPSYETIN